jgi:putative transposase
VAKYLGKVFHELARQRESRILEGHLCPDHVHMLIEIPPKYAVSAVVGYIKGKSAITIARTYVGKYIQEQEDEDKRQLEMFKDN